jgi:SAM-dependent methyltransferase
MSPAPADPKPVAAPPGGAAAANHALNRTQPCPFCSHPETFVKYVMEAHQIWRCRACTFMWIHPRPTVDDLKAVYDVSYFHNEHFFMEDTAHLYGYYDYLSERFTKQSSYQDIVQGLKQMLPDFAHGRARLLDVGCGMGYLMDVAHDEGFQVTGVEFNPFAAERLKSKYAFPVHVGDVLDFHGEPFDVVTLMDVVEHFLDPFQSMEHIGGLVRPGGLLTLTTMDSDSVVSRMLGTRLEDFRRVREHLLFFTRKSIRALLERYGFEVVSIRYYGHAFKLSFLADRVKLISKPLGQAAYVVVKGLGLKNVSIMINPMTKMIVYARKRPA